MHFLVPFVHLPLDKCLRHHFPKALIVRIKLEILGPRVVTDLWRDGHFDGSPAVTLGDELALVETDT